MPVRRVNGVELFYEVTGRGEPLVLVHPSWGDHHSWDPVVTELRESFEVVVYDRRGHSQSERPAGQGSVQEDADDLAELIEALELGPAHVVANSFGSVVALNAAIRRPEVFATLVAHEPPLLGMLTGNQFEPVLQEVNRRVGNVIELLDAREDEAAAKLFVDTVARRPGAWEEEVPAQLREVFIGNAPTFLDEARDPNSQRLDLDRLRRFDRPALLTKGTISPPFLIAIVEAIGSALPRFEIQEIEGADHAPHQTTTKQYIDLVQRFVEHSALWPAEHYYGAVCMGNAVLADRSDQHADECAVASTAYDQERRTLRPSDERGGGLSLFYDSGYLDGRYA